MARTSVLLALVAVAGCRPDSYGRPIRVEVPVTADDGSNPSAEIGMRYGPGPDVRVEAPPGTTPPTLRPGYEVQVLVPRDETLPRGVKKSGMVH